MSKEIRIRITDDIAAAVALNVVKTAIVNNIEPGEVITFSNDACVEYRKGMKNQNFYVWKREAE